MRKIRLFFLVISAFLVYPSVALGEVHIPFDGTIDFVNGTFSATIKDDQQDIQIDCVRDDKFDFHASIRLQPLSVGDAHLKSDIKLSLNQRIVNDTLASARMGIQSHYTLINGKPIKDLVGDLEWRDDKLWIHSLEIGAFLIQGAVAPQSEKPIDVTIQWRDVELEPALNMTRPVEKHVVAEGVASGNIRIIGSWRHPRMVGVVSTYNGFIDDFVFDSINFRFEGEYPVIHITEAILNRPGQVTGNLTGTIDVTNLATFITQFKALKKAPIIQQDDENEVGWVYKRVTAENDLGKSVSEMKYFIRKEDEFHGREDTQGGMLGVERRFDF